MAFHNKFYYRHTHGNILDNNQMFQNKHLFLINRTFRADLGSQQVNIFIKVIHEISRKPF